MRPLPVHPLRLIALMHELPAGGARRLAAHPDYRVREAAAGNTGTPADVLITLATDRAQGVRRAALAVVTDPSLAAHGLRYGTRQARLGAAANPCLPPATLADAVAANARHSGDRGLRRALLANPSTPFEVVRPAAARCGELVALCGDAYTLHVQVAAMLDVHPGLLTGWTAWGDPVIRRIVARSVTAEADVAAFMAAQSTCCHGVLGTNPSVPLGMLPAVGPAATGRRRLDAILAGATLSEALSTPATRAALAVLGSPAVDVALCHTGASDVAVMMATRSATLDPDVAANLARTGYPAALAVARNQSASRTGAAAIRAPLLRALAEVDEAVHPLPDLGDLSALLSALGEDHDGWTVLMRLAQDTSLDARELLIAAAGVSVQR